MVLQSADLLCAGQGKHAGRSDAGRRMPGQREIYGGADTGICQERSVFGQPCSGGYRRISYAGTDEAAGNGEQEEPEEKGG